MSGNESTFESGSKWCGWIRLGPRHWDMICVRDTREEVETFLEKHYSTKYHDVGDDKPLLSKRRETCILRYGIERIGEERRSKRA